MKEVQVSNSPSKKFELVLVERDKDGNPLYMSGKIRRSRVESDNSWLISRFANSRGRLKGVRND